VKFIFGTYHFCLQVRPLATEQNPFQSQVRILVRGEMGSASVSSMTTKLVFTLHSFVQDWYGGMSDHICTLLPCVECLKRRRENPSAPPGLFFLFLLFFFVLILSL
jgi:hypothetical protein